jgi:hypothetical protein
MADKTHRVDFQITATDKATQVFKDVKGSVDGLKTSYTALAGAATAALGAGGMAAFLADAVHYRAALADLADITGDNVTTLDRLSRQARISGRDFDALQGSISKFAKNLNDSGDEGKNAAQAIEALGLNVEELRAMKPADAMLAVAQALNHFEDGASKVAVAVALMGKEGAKNLPFLKDLAENQEALGRLTAEQAEQAKRLEQEWRKLKMAFEDSKSALADGLVPWMGNLVEQMREGIRIAGSFGAAVRLFGLNMNPTGDLAGAIRERQQALNDWQGAGAFGRFVQKPFGSSYAGTEDDIKKQIEFLKFMQRQQALSGRTGGEFLDARDLAARQKDTLNFLPTKPGGDEKSSLWTAQDEEMFQARRKAWEESDKIEEDFSKDEEQRAKDQQTMWKQVFDEIDAEQQRAIESGAAYLKDLEDNAKKGSDAARELGMTFSSAFEDAVINGKKFDDILQSIGMDVARIILRKGVTEPAAGAIGAAIKDYLPFAEGGVMTSMGAMPLRRYDAGGIADSPQLAMFGEGSMNEAYVPLPDGRRIPVQMSGQSGHTFIIDARGADRTGLARLEAYIRRVDGSVEYRSVAAARRAAAVRGRSTAF